jgi:multicomponent Na+:H+ antiporter subunit B
MIELYLRLVGRTLTPLLWFFAAFFLLRGHDEPGGGFVAALLGAAAITIQILVKGAGVVRRRFGRMLRPTLGLGLFVAAFAASLGMFLDDGFFHATWGQYQLGTVKIKLGTPNLFDLGVFLTVLGVTVSFILGLSESVLEAPGEDTEEVILASTDVLRPDVTRVNSGEAEFPLSPASRGES